ncbi:hypothetical protein BGZ61DRAFT_457301 [Ilyonectria robusta]|uniref:uncharacterized protein n=1 Tax=Ilyonectria robusta TaxID=1079257 RepID=UPI001E8EA859|nr:uncharacterized protein BGZ61DRAFT_457301 [Ilyonectria robusta]KAH8676938.1 hypothetical protein BGZ61DRAFT_457301 [Ilyonectria robusta]
MLAALMDLGRGRYQTSNSHKPLIRISTGKATRPGPPATGSSARPVPSPPLVSAPEPRFCSRPTTRGT